MNGLATSYRLVREGEYPAIVASMGVAAIEKPDSESSDLSYFKSGNVGLTTYKSIDSLLLSLNTSYAWNDLEVGNDSFKYGDTLSISPNISFAVNQ